MSIGFEESRAHGHVESRAHQRRGRHPAVPPASDFTEPWFRQAVGCVPMGGFAGGDYFSRYALSDNPVNIERTTEGISYSDIIQGIYDSLWGGNYPSASECRCIGINMAESLYPGPVGRFHIRKWRMDMACADSRAPFSSGWFQKVDRIHMNASTAAVLDSSYGWGDLAEQTIETQAGVVLHMVLGDDGTRTITGTEDPFNNPAYVWYLAMWDGEAFFDSYALARTVNTMTGTKASFEGTFVRFDHFGTGDHLIYTLNISVELLQTDFGDSAYLGDPSYRAAALIRDNVNLLDKTREYDLSYSGAGTRALADNECIYIFPTKPTDDVPARTVLSLSAPFVAWPWTDTPTVTAWPIWAEGEWVPVRQSLIMVADKNDFGYAIAGVTLLGLLPGRYQMYWTDFGIPRGATIADPDNGNGTYKRHFDEAGDRTDFDILKPTEKFYGVPAYGASSVTRLGDLPAGGSVAGVGGESLSGAGGDPLEPAG